MQSENGRLGEKGDEEKTREDKSYAKRKKIKRKTKMRQRGKHCQRNHQR